MEEDVAEAEWGAERRRVRRRGIIKEDEVRKRSREEERAEAWADMRRQRAAKGVQRERMCVVQDESDESEGMEE